MTTHDYPAVAAGLSLDPARWRDQFDDLMGRIAGRFARVELWRRALDRLTSAYGFGAD